MGYPKKTLHLPLPSICRDYVSFREGIFILCMNQINLSFSLTVVGSEFSSDVPTGSVVSSISKVSKFGFYCISCQLNPLLGGGFKGSL